MSKSNLVVTEPVLETDYRYRKISPYIKLKKWRDFQGFSYNQIAPFKLLLLCPIYTNSSHQRICLLCDLEDQRAVISQRIHSIKDILRSSF